MRVRLTSEDRNRIQRFKEEFNQLEQQLRRGFGRKPPLVQIVKSYAQTHRGWKHEQELLGLLNLRNDISHAEGTDRLLALPTEFAIRDVRRIRRSIAWLQAVGVRFRKKVEFVNPDTTVATVLSLVSERDYSQFPIEEQGHVKGLITENGITRWFAKRYVSGASWPDPDQTPIKALYRNEENRTAYVIVPRHQSVESAVGEFYSHPDLEAILITEGGKNVLPLLGIITRWDVLDLTRAI